LVKGGLFLAIGVAAVNGARLWPVLIPAAVLALGLGGLPFTGGMLAKLAVKAQFGEGVLGIFATLSAVGSTVLMLHFLQRLAQTLPRDGQAPGLGVGWPWLAIACAAVAVPWVLYPTVGGGALLEAVATRTLWAALWPVLIGVVLAIGMWRWGHRLPRVPEGDVVVVGEKAMRATMIWGELIERADDYLRQWPLASLSLLAFVIILGTVMLAWG
jgi:hypothetical protein